MQLDSFRSDRFCPQKPYSTGNLRAIAGQTGGGRAVQDHRGPDQCERTAVDPTQLAVQKAEQELLGKRARHDRHKDYQQLDRGPSHAVTLQEDYAERSRCHSLEGLRA